MSSPADIPPIGKGTVVYLKPLEPQQQQQPVPGPPVTLAPTFTAQQEPRSLGSIPADAATLDAYQWQSALDHMFRLNTFGAELDVIRRVKSAYPTELREAEALTLKHLGSWKDMRKRATDSYMNSAMGGSVIQASLPARINWVLAAVLTPALVTLGTAALSDLIYGGITGILSAVLYFGLVTRPGDAGVVVVSHRDWKAMRNDVVDATLADLLRHKNKPLTPEAEDALRRGWAHIRFIGYTTEAMRTPPVANLRMGIPQQPAQKAA